jgi:hypothetical protein
MPKLQTGTIKYPLPDGGIVSMSVTVQSADGVTPTAPKQALELLLDKAIQILGEAATEETIAVQQELFDER